VGPDIQSEYSGQKEHPGTPNGSETQAIWPMAHHSTNQAIIDQFCYNFWCFCDGDYSDYGFLGCDTM
jgi:hypothetical protein